MKHGDISNRQSPILAFNIDNLLFGEEEKTGLLGKIVNNFGSHKSKYLNRKLDDVFVKSLEALWNNYNYSLYLVTNEEFTTEIEEKLAEHNVCYTKLMCYLELSDLRNVCHNQCTYYFDNDESIISYMSSPKAVHIRELWMKVGKV